jgi:hypothetical protein
MDELFKKLNEIKDLKVKEQTQRSILADLYRNNFYCFARDLVGFKDINWRTHGELCRALESPKKRKAICFPRGAFKSSLAVIAYSIWKLIKNPEERILIDSQLYTNSSNFLHAIKGYLVNPQFTYLYGDFKTKDWGETITIAQRKKVWVESSITCGGVGTTKVGQHFSTILGDDYNSPSNSDTPEKCEKVINHIKYNLSILDPGGEYTFIGTRYAENDVMGWILRDLLNLKDLADGKMHKPVDEMMMDAQAKPDEQSGLIQMINDG